MTFEFSVFSFSFVRGVKPELLPMVPIPLGDLIQGHAKLVADGDFRCEVPHRVPLEVDKELLDLALVLSLLLAHLDTLKVLLFNTESCLVEV